jgi:hypothetical protein
MICAGHFATHSIADAKGGLTHPPISVQGKIIPPKKIWRLDFNFLDFLFAFPP